MQISIPYSKLSVHNSSLLLNTQDAFLKLRENNTHKFSIPIEPQKWHWKIYGTMKLGFSVTPNKEDDLDFSDLVKRELQNERLELTIQATFNDIKVNLPFPKYSEPGFFLPDEVILALNPKSAFLNNTKPTVLIYTEEKRGNQLVESIILGGLSDFSGSEKFIVIKDPYNNINFVYKIAHESTNLEAMCILTEEEANFEKYVKPNITFNNSSYKISSPDDAVKLLKNKTRWIQDKGSVLSVLLQKARKENPLFNARPISRPHVKKIPDNVPTDFIGSLDIRKKSAEVENNNTFDNRKKSNIVYVK